MRPLPIFLSLLCLLLFCQCSSIDPATKASYKRVVVASNVGKQVTRYKVGITVFGNDKADGIRSTELQKASDNALRLATKGKFPETIYSSEEPPHAPEKMFSPAVDYSTWAKALGTKHQADAVLVFAGFRYYPYGAPSYMTAEGMGVWHIGNNAEVQVYISGMLIDVKTGKTLRNVGRFKKGMVLHGIEFKPKFEDYSANDKHRLIQTCADEYLAEMNAYLKNIGY